MSGLANITPQEALVLANQLSDTIRARRPDIALNVRYFKGTEGKMRFASDEFKRYFQHRFADFSDNWCMPVAQAPVERMRYLGMRLDGETSVDPEIARRWERNDADRGLAEALMMMTVAKRSFSLVSPTPRGARVTFEHPDSAAVVYDPITRERRAGLVLWQDDTTEYGELHLPTSVLSVRREKVAVSGGDRYVPPDADGWEFDTSRDAVERPNPLGAVALVEFRNQALLDNDPLSDIAGVRAMQDAINLIWAYVLNTLDYASLPGRAILGGEQLLVPILDDEGQKIGERPLELDAMIRDRMIHIPSSSSGGQNPTIGEWSAADPGPLSAVIEQALGHVAAQTRTPGHYLLSRSNIPATGYELSEAGLVSKTLERIGYASGAVKETNRLMALADGQTAQAERIAHGEARWHKPQYRSEAQLMDGLLKMREAGFPFRWIAEEYGLSPADVERVMEMKRKEESDPLFAELAANALPDDFGQAAVETTEV